MIELGDVAFVTKLAGFEHTKFIQPNARPQRMEHDDVPMFIGKNIKNGKLTDDIQWFLPKEISLGLERSSLVNKCIVLPYVGSVGDLAIYDKIDRHHLASNVAKIELSEDAPFSLEYLYYYLKSPFGQNQLLFYIQGGIQKNITMKAIRKTQVALVSNEKRVVKTLSDLDAKIELNQKINAELESMAKLIYDYWFVQFDFPDENGKPYKTSGGKMVYNEELNREIPEGWGVSSLLDVATFTNGIACQKYRPEAGDESLKVIKIREMRTGFTEDSELVKASIPEKVKVYNGDILFSWSASLLVKLWSGGNGALNQHIFKVTSNKFPQSFILMELQRYLIYFQKVAELRKTTMGHITRDHLKDSRIAVPPSHIIQMLDDKLKPVYEKVINSNIENSRLEEVRNWLLPMLMNGQVTIKD